MLASTSPPTLLRPLASLRAGRSRLLLGGVGLGVIIAVAAWQWSWRVAIGVAPLLLSVAPCAAMCGLGLCMHRMGGRTCSMPLQKPSVKETLETPCAAKET
jgi:hypothetical protein